MNILLLVTANIVLFLGSLIGGYLSHSYQVSKKFGFVSGPVAGVIPNEKEQRAFNLLSSAEVVLCLVLSFVVLLIIGFEYWASFMFSPTIGIVIGIIVLNRTTHQRVKPSEWK